MALPINHVITGDCLQVLADFPEGEIDLAYLDPPFNTGKTQTAANGDYDDSWADLVTYLDFMQARVEVIHRVLKTTGSILLHCDWRTCHHLRLMLDKVFGETNFVNHLIWQYGLGGSSPRRFARKHDDILFYAKSADYYFSPPLVPATSNRMRGQMKKASDVIDIASINNMASERVGYPTQKPLALLELLVQACSPLNAIILDPFCGSGTTMIAAQTSGRRFIGIDCNPDAVGLTTRRLKTLNGRQVPKSKDRQVSRSASQR